MVPSKECQKNNEKAINMNIDWTKVSGPKRIAQIKIWASVTASNSQQKKTTMTTTKRKRTEFFMKRNAIWCLLLFTFYAFHIVHRGYECVCVLCVIVGQYMEKYIHLILFFLSFRYPMTETEMYGKSEKLISIC